MYLSKTVSRKYFSEEIKEDVLSRQMQRYTECNKILTIVKFDHLDGDRSDNSPSNCQSLCPAL